MPRLSGKGGLSKKIDVTVPNLVFDRIVQLAKESGAPVHHRSGEPTLSPTVLHLILLGIQLIEADPDKLSEPISSTPADPRLGEVITAMGKLADRIEALEDNLQTLTADEVRRVVDAQLSPLMTRVETLESVSAQPPKPAIRTALAKSDPSDRIPLGEFCKEHELNISRKMSATEINAAIAAAGLGEQYRYSGKDKAVYAISHNTEANPIDYFAPLDEQP